MHALDLLVRLHDAVRTRPPGRVAPAEIDAFVHRHRAVLLALIEDRLHDREPDLWTPSKRTKANLAAMDVLARGVTFAEDRRTLSRYSGWGGLSLRPSVRAKFPSGVPVPDKASLVHEYYTPSRESTSTMSWRPNRGAFR